MRTIIFQAMPEGTAGRHLEVESTLRLIERARTGDQEALDKLFARHSGPLRRWATGRLPKWARDMTDTDDLVQETLLRTFKRIDHFEPRGIGALQARTFAREPAVSPDGSLIAYNFQNRQASPQWKIAVIPANGGTPLKVFDRRRAEYQTFELNWTPDGRAITYEATQEGVSNIWSQPLAGGPPQRLTDFTTDYIYGFAWAFDGRQLAVVRGAWDSDALLLSLRR